MSGEPNNPFLGLLAEAPGIRGCYTASLAGNSLHLYGYWGRYCELMIDGTSCRLYLIIDADWPAPFKERLAELELSNPVFLPVLFRKLRWYIGFWSFWRYAIE